MNEIWYLLVFQIVDVHLDILDLMDKNLLNNSNKAHAARVDGDNLDHVYKTLGHTMDNLEF